jgi:hypothetical protein
MLDAQVIGFALPTTKRVLFEVVPSAVTTGDRGISLHDSEVICNLDCAALYVDVLDTERNATFFVRFDLDGALTILAFHDAIYRSDGNGSATVRAFAGDGFGHGGTPSPLDPREWLATANATTAMED